MAIGVSINGAAGRMGRALLRLVADAEDLFLCGAFEASSNDAIGTDASFLYGGVKTGITVSEKITSSGADVIVDFSLPAGTGALLNVLGENPCPLICGTTGLGDEERREIERLSGKAPVVWAANFSTGVTLLFDLVERASRMLGPDYEAEVVELHHHHKKDAPSGTAVGLVERIAGALDYDMAEDTVHGRRGAVGARPVKEIGVHALRGGDVVGEHTVYLIGEGERIELAHRASSRDAFAAGALRAARWVVNAPVGLYDMRDVLQLKG